MRRVPLDQIDRLAASALDLAQRWRYIGSGLLLWAYRCSDQRAVVDADARRWAAVLQVSYDEETLLRLLFAFAEFRSVFYYRLRRGNPAGVLAADLAERRWPPAVGLDLSKSNAGPGLFVSHGQGTVLAAERIGADCHVHQGVTVGWDYRSGRLPVVGDGVFIGAGAKVLGAVTVGDGARIGANAVVLGDVPPGATAVGAPARVTHPAQPSRIVPIRLPRLTAWSPSRS